MDNHLYDTYIHTGIYITYTAKTKSTNNQMPFKKIAKMARYDFMNNTRVSFNWVMACLHEISSFSIEVPTFVDAISMKNIHQKIKWN